MKGEIRQHQPRSATPSASMRRIINVVVTILLIAAAVALVALQADTNPENMFTQV